MKVWALTFLALCATGFVDPWSELLSDRAAVERVYHNHRFGEKPPFEKVMPRGTITRLVRQDLYKEAVLKKAYGIVITSEQLADEVKRINATSRAPEILAELKSALGYDTGRFARIVAKPVLVERLLRERFDADDQLHAAPRQEARQARSELLAAKKDGASSDKLLALLKQKHSNAVTETTWQLGARPPETDKSNPDLADIQKRFGPDAQILSSAETADEQEFYFEDLPPELQNVLRIQLRQAGDVSDVVEMPRGFVMYMAKERTATRLTVAALSVRKRSCEQWLEQNRAQPEIRAAALLVD
jgi:hypothetical protein